MHWNAKRLMGYINFWTKRRYFNDPSLVHALVADMKTQSFDHIAVTGDLANIGMPAEFEQARRWLDGLGTPDDVTVIPGNHDIYCRLRSDLGVERWRPFMRPRDEQDVLEGCPGPLASGFPFVRRFGQFALICLNSAVPTPPAVASGRLGEDQLARFVAQSHALHTAGFARIVLIHHAPLPEHGPRGLTDATAFEHALMEAGAELVLHGHNHRHMISWRETATGPVAIVGAGSVGEGAYNIYQIERLEDGVCRVELVCRSGSRGDLSFKEARRLVIDARSTDREAVL